MKSVSDSEGKPEKECKNSNKQQVEYAAFFMKSGSSFLVLVKSEGGENEN